MINWTFVSTWLREPSWPATTMQSGDSPSVENW
jgi:hypothetical protein